jgi:hypothetical protein
MLLISRDSINTIERLNPVNSPRTDLSLAHTPIYSEEYGLLGFIVPYELYVMDLRSKKAKLIVKNQDNPIYSFRFFNNTRELIYVNDNETSFCITNFDGSSVRKISFNL